MNWVAPDVVVERADLEQAAEEMKIPLGLMLSCRYDFEPLDSEVWARLDTPTRYRAWTVKQIVNRVKGLGQECRWILGGLFRGNAVPGPIILFRWGLRPAVISGGFRLTVAKLLGQPVKALHLRVR